MAYVVLGSQTNDLFNTAGTSYTPAVYPTGLADGDLVFAFVAINSASAVLSCATSGWNLVGTKGSNPTQASYGQFFYAVVSGGTYNVPTFSSTVSGRMGSVMFGVRDADTTTPIDVALQTNYATTTPATGAPTTTSDACLILHGWSHSTINAMLQPDRSKAQVIDAQINTNTPSAMVSFAGQVSAGAVDSYTAAVAATSGGGAQWTIAVKNKSGGRASPHVSYNMEVVSWYGNTAAGASPITWQGPEETGNKFAGGFTGGTLNGVTVTTGAITAANTAFLTNVNTSAVNNVIDGAWHSVSLDCTDKIFSAELQTSRATSTLRIGSMGLLVGFSDGTNYEIFLVKNPARGWVGATDFRVFVACGKTTPKYSRGTLNWSAITQVGYFLHHLQTTVDTFSVKNAFLVSGCTLTGGGGAYPTNAAEFAKIMLQSRLTGMVALQSTAQTQIKHSLSIGDGTRPTFYDSEAASVAFPQSWSEVSVANWQDEWNVPDASVSVNIKASASDSVSLGASVLSSQTKQTFLIDPASSGSATYNFGGASFVGLDNVWNSSVDCALSTFLRCHQINGKSATFSDCSFKSCASALTAYVTTENGGAFLQCSFTKGLETYAINFTQAGDYDLSGSVFSGYTNPLYIAATTGTVNITRAQGDATLTYVSAGATVNFIQPVVQAHALISGIVAGSRLQIYNVTTATEMVNAINATTSYTLDYDNGTGYSDGDIVRVRLTYCVGLTAKLPVEYVTIASAAGWSVLANQQDDEVYIANGIDGSTVTEYSSDYVNVQIDVSDPDGVTSIQRGYAWYCDQMTGDDGIRYFYGAFQAEDAFNYLLNTDVADIKIQNTGATGVTLTGGAVRRKDGTSPIAPGGSVYIYYGRTYGLETGVSGLTATESSKLLSLNTDAVNVASMNGAAVIGDGSVSDPWRGVGVSP